MKDDIEGEMESRGKRPGKKKRRRGDETRREERGEREGGIEEGKGRREVRYVNEWRRPSHIAEENARPREPRINTPLEALSHARALEGEP